MISNPGYSGFLRRRYDQPDETIAEIQVSTDTLDHVLEKENIHQVSLIKIDVEGAEYLVLKGARKTITKYRPIILFECGPGSTNYYGVQSEDLFDLLNNEYQLHISTLPDWLRGKRPLSAGEFSEKYESTLNFIAHP